jgi:23S rRNA (cytidine1920-2'-O)/16S rRNA (cytidine1409-2'-O)-methyltransferase
MGKAQRERADVLLVERGLAPTRAKAQALLLAGRVYTGEARVDKAGTLLSREAPLSLKGELNPYVSRGGLKLAGALAAFAPYGLDPVGAVAVDVGASTGGFTDCLLQAGANRVYAVDVGYGQLHERLRADARVVVLERTNARTLTAEALGGLVDLVTVDASFIGLGHLAPAVACMLKPNGWLCALVKPQFEAGREAVRRGKGVIRDEAERQTAIGSATAAVEAAGFELIASADCVIAGPKGNREHFVLARPKGALGHAARGGPKGVRSGYGGRSERLQGGARGASGASCSARGGASALARAYRDVSRRPRPGRPFGLGRSR